MIKSIWETTKPLFTTVGQIGVELAATVATAKTAAELVATLTGTPGVGFIVASAISVGASRAIMEGPESLQSTMENLQFGETGILLKAVVVASAAQLLPSQFIAGCAIFYSSMFLAIIVGNGARLTLNRLGWNEFIASPVVFIGGAATALLYWKADCAPSQSKNCLMS